MILSLMLTLSLGMTGQPQKAAAPVAPPPELSVLVERVVRLADLQRRKLDVEQELAAKQLGSEHPEAIALRAKLADLQSAIRREGLQGYHSDVNLIAEKRIALENQLDRLKVGKLHPDHQSLSTQIATFREQERVAAVAVLSSGIEADLKAAIARQPNDVLAYLELAGLYVTAGRTNDAATMLTEAQAALKRAGGR